jgi:hypothetical protein
MEESVLKDSKMRKHVTVVGAIHIGFGLLGLICALSFYSILPRALYREKKSPLLF